MHKKIALCSLLVIAGLVQASQQQPQTARVTRNNNLAQDFKSSYVNQGSNGSNIVRSGTPEKTSKKVAEQDKIDAANQQAPRKQTRPNK